MTAAAINHSYYNYFRPSRTGASETSEYLANIIESAMTHYRTTASNEAKENLKYELFNLATERCEDNWDDLGANALSSDAIQDGLLFLDNLPSWFNLPEALPEPDGSIGFEWYYAPDRQFVISFSGEGEVAFAGKLGKKERIHGIEEFNGSLSLYIRESIRRITDQT